MKHAPLHKVVEHHSNGKDEFWYVETHTGYPYYYPPAQGSWQAGIEHVVQRTNQQPAPPSLLTDFANVAYHDKQDVHVRFPDKRTYLGSAAQIFHILKDKQKRVRMTLFELNAEKAQNFVDSCMRQNRQIAWLSWTGSNGARQKVYGCQLTFGHVLSGNFTTASIWQFANPNTLPYLDLMNRFANPGQQGPNFQNPATTSTCWPKGFFLKKVG